MACSDCHVVPATTAGHGQGSRATVTFSALASPTGAATWNRTTGTCAVYCHGKTLGEAGSRTDPVWNAGAPVSCGSCHGLPPAGHAAFTDLDRLPRLPLGHGEGRRDHRPRRRPPRRRPPRSDRPRRRRLRQLPRRRPLHRRPRRPRQRPPTPPTACRAPPPISTRPPPPAATSSAAASAIPSAAVQARRRRLRGRSLGGLRSRRQHEAPQRRRRRLRQGDRHLQQRLLPLLRPGRARPS